MSEKQTEEALPMFNRDEIATEAGFFDVMFRLHDIKRECVMPAKVEKYDRSTRLATIKPLVQKFKTTQDGKVFWDRDSYEEIPVVSPFHGGFTIDFPVNEGDQGYLIAIDRPWDEIFDTIQEKGKEWDYRFPVFWHAYFVRGYCCPSFTCPFLIGQPGMTMDMEPIPEQPFRQRIP